MRKTFSIIRDNVLRLAPIVVTKVEKMGYGSAGTPPWVDEERIDEEKKQRKAAENEEKLKALQKENATLRKRVKQLEHELQELEK